MTSNVNATAAPTLARPVEQRLAVRNEADVHGAVMLCYSMLSQINEGNVLSTELATVVSELGMNIVKYAPAGGSLWLRLQAQGPGWIEVVAEDHGPGISNLHKAMQESYSSTGTLGLGLPGVKRMADEFHIESTVGVGTTVRAKKWLQASAARNLPQVAIKRTESPPVRPTLPDAHPEAAPLSPETPVSRAANASSSALPSKPGAMDTPRFDYAAINRPCAGESASGDATLCIDLPSGPLLAIIDVLGHGPEAHELARICTHWLHQYTQVQPRASVEAMLLALDLHIKGSRGVAISLAKISADQVEVAGVGNTILYCVSDKVTPVSAQPGILGGNMPRLRPRSFALLQGDLLVLTSDGISERLDSAFLLGTSRANLQNYAQAVLRGYGRTHDDATCLVYRHGVSHAS